MQEAKIVSIDAMGGDSAPDIVIDGLQLIYKQFSDVKYLLHGDRDKLLLLLKKYPDLASFCEIRHCEDVVSNDMKPSQAIRTCRKSSMWQAIESVAEGRAEAIVSAGNTGALMAMSKLQLRMLPGIHRPAIVGLLPTVKGRLSVVLDLGGNTECDAVNLVQFALMGEIFARCVLGIENPQIGLLNIGSEEMKGRDEIKEAAKILKESSIGKYFYGFVEGHDIGAGTVDVVVTDGFTGNVALKSIEGTAKLLSRLLKDAAYSSLLSKIGFMLAKKSLRNFKDKIDPRCYNGAMFVGLNGIAMKSHGGTDAFGFANAVKATANVMKNGINKQIKHELEKTGFTAKPQDTEK